MRTRGRTVPRTCHLALTGDVSRAARRTRIPTCFAPLRQAGRRHAHEASGPGGANRPRHRVTDPAQRTDLSWAARLFS
ncbi:hypothetical protein PSA01_35430 [Pseudonocardia saturnea]|uniref:Uncharacterized protein n=1 Tax=Pseudonocardia saturnea TaxID=33909 RepID=A0ABQ0S1L3_9PSEU|nr:hypothetical protein PSA01_35430 [Pseudonocardia saturnea]